MIMIRGLLAKMLLLVAFSVAISLSTTYVIVTTQQHASLQENIENIQHSHRIATLSVFDNLVLNQTMPFTEEIIRLGGMQGKSADEIEAFLRNIWKRIQFTFDFKSMAFANAESQFNFGRFPTQKMSTMMRTVEMTNSPQKSIICSRRCEIATVVPVTTNTQTWSLAVLADVNPSIDLLSTLVDSEIINLLPNQQPNPTDLSLARYVSISDYMTGQEEIADLFQITLTPDDIGRLATESIVIHDHDTSHLVWIEQIDSLGDPMRLVFIHDITSLLSQQAQQQRQIFMTFVTLTLGVLLFLMLFSILPITKINKLKRAIQLIASNEYKAATYRLGKLRRPFIHDELYDLENEFRTAIQVLERYQGELEQSQKRLLRQATIDATTGLYNRNVLMEDLTNLASQSYIKNVAVLFLDLDGFKPVNDNLGHEAGDVVLKKIGYRLKGITNKFTRIYRVGGDEFIICYTNYGNIENLQRMAQEVVELFDAPFNVSESYITITASIGIATQETRDIHAENLLRFADIAMYQTKKDGKTRYRFYDDSMRETARRRFVIKNDFEQSLANNQLFLVYQPIIDCRTHRVVKIEALCRWQHPSFGLIPPDLFIDVIEGSESITSLFHFVVTQVIAEIRCLDRLGYSDMVVSINLSASQLIDNMALYILESTLKEHQISPSRIEIEITETSLISNFEDAEQWIQSAKRLGIKIAIDDFGTGYSSLSYLTIFSYDSVKLDRSLLNNIDNDVRQQRVVSSLVSMLHSLEVPVVAEGIETDQHYAELEKIGCDFAQGYLFCRPLPHDQLIKYLDKQSSHIGQYQAS